MSTDSDYFAGDLNEFLNNNTDISGDKFMLLKTLSGLCAALSRLVIVITTNCNKSPSVCLSVCVCMCVRTNFTWV